MFTQTTKTFSVSAKFAPRVAALSKGTGISAVKTLLVVILALIIAASLGCAKGVEEVAVTPDSGGNPAYKVGFNTSGLAGSGLVVQINSENDLVVVGEGVYTFDIELNEGDFFELSIKQQPSGPNQICMFNKLSGEINGSVKLELVLDCVNVSYSVGGTINIDLSLLDQLIVAVNGNPAGLKFDSTGNFTFVNKYEDAQELFISFDQFPNFQTCTINGKETHSLMVSGSDVSDLAIDCGFTSPLIDIQPMEFDITKKGTFTTPSIYDYITDIEVGGNPSVTQWNSRIVAKSGSVVYNGNGTFSYKPNSNVVSGQDSFSFRVANRSGTEADGIITLRIAKGWGNKNDISTTVDSRLNTALELGGRLIVDYYDGNVNKFQTLDIQSHTWLPSKEVGTSIVKIIESATQTIKYFSATSAGNESILYSRQYFPETDTLSTQVELERIAATNLNPYRGITDDQGNIFISLIRSYTDANNYYYTEFWGKYYSAASKSWLPAVLMYDSTRGVIQQNDIFLVGGNPVNFVRFPNGAIPVVFELNPSNNIVTETPISTEQLSTTSNNAIGWYNIAQNTAGHIALLWFQTVTDSALAQDFRHVKSYIYTAAGALPPAEKTLHKITANKVPMLQLSVLNNSDFLFMWRPYIASSNDPNYPSADVYAQRYNAQTQSYDAAVSDVVLDHQGSYLNVTPTPTVEGGGNVIFSYWTKDVAGNYTHLFKALPYRGNAWSAEQQININPVSASRIYSNFDSMGNYYVIFNKPDTSNGFYSARKYDFTTNSNSSIIPADNNNTAKSLPGIARTNNRMFFYWSKLNAASQNDLCLREINIGTEFSSGDLLSAEDCINFSYQNTSAVNVSLFEDSAQNLLAFVSASSIYFAKKSANTWSSPETLFTPVLKGSSDSFYNKLYLWQYGSLGAMSLIVQHRHEYYDAFGNNISEQSIFNYLYN